MPISSASAMRAASLPGSAGFVLGAGWLFWGAARSVNASVSTLTPVDARYDATAVPGTNTVSDAERARAAKRTPDSATAVSIATRTRDAFSLVTENGETVSNDVPSSFVACSDSAISSGAARRISLS